MMGDDGVSGDDVMEVSGRPNQHVMQQQYSIMDIVFRDGNQSPSTAQCRIDPLRKSADVRKGWLKLQVDGYVGWDRVHLSDNE